MRERRRRPSSRAMSAVGAWHDRRPVLPLVSDTQDEDLLTGDALDDPPGRTHHPRLRQPAAPCLAPPHVAGARGHTVVAFRDRTGWQVAPLSWPHVGPERTYRRATTGAHTPGSTTRPEGPAAGPRRRRRRRRAARRHNRSVSPPGDPSARACGPPRGTD